jgi:hypothetical protein
MFQASLPRTLPDTYLFLLHTSRLVRVRCLERLQPDHTPALSDIFEVSRRFGVSYTLGASPRLFATGAVEHLAQCGWLVEKGRFGWKFASNEGNDASQSSQPKTDGRVKSRYYQSVGPQVPAASPSNEPIARSQLTARSNPPIMQLFSESMEEVVVYARQE